MHRPCAFADRLKVLLDALPENGDRLFDDGAALLLLLHRNPFALCVAPLSDVLVRRNPATIGHGTIDDRYRPPIRRLYFGAGCLACGHGAHQVAPVCDRIMREAAVADSVLEQILQGDAWLNDVA